MRIRTLIGLIAIGSTLLAGCGGTASGSTSSTVAGSSAGPASAPAKPASSAAPQRSASGTASSAAPATGLGSASPAAGQGAGSAPASSSGTAAAATGTPIKIGVIADITGVFAGLGAEMHLTTDMVVSQVNSSGGIDGHPLQVTYVDAKGDPAQAISAATKLVQQDKVDVLMGAASSAECIGVEKLAPKLSTLYVIDTCAADEITSQNCNNYTFRVYSAGRQLSDPLASYLVKTYGKSWGIIYPDYALGQSQVKTFTDAFSRLGAQLKVKIPVPVNEPNVQPYVSKIPTDGSIVGIIEAEGGSDLVRSLQAMQSFGITKKMQLVLSSGGLEHFDGSYPPVLTGAIENGLSPSSAQAGNTAEEGFFKAFRAQAAKDTQSAGILGGPAKATPGNELGYSAYISMTALVQGMKASHFSGKADTTKLIDALANLKGAQGPSFPAGPVVVNPTDHQGRSTVYVLKVSGAQKEDVLEQVAPDQIPPIGSCKVATAS